MASGTAADFMIYHEQFFTGMTEVLQQNATVFNGASNGAITLVTRMMRGDYEQASFMKAISNVITRRDTTAVDSAIADTPLIQDEEVGVKSNLKIGPVADTYDAFKKIQADPAIFSLMLGRQTATGLMVKYVDSGLAAAVGAMLSVAAIQNDVTGGGTTTITNSALMGTMAKFGDASTRISAWVMHSKVFFDLMGDNVSNGAALFDVPGLVVRAGEPGVPGLGRPIIVVDSSSLVNTTPTPDQYYTLGLVESGLEVAESEERTIVTDDVTGQEQLKIRIQGEVAVNYKVRGYKYDIGAGGANPTDATLISAANWDQAASDTKSTAGVMLISE